MVEVATYVIRVCHIVEICLVAAEAIGTETLEPAVLVAKTTISGYMSSSERKNSARVIERRGLPGDGGMARRAIMGELSKLMVRSLDIVEICNVARITIRRQCCELAILVTGRTLESLMRTGERKTRLVVIKAGKRPGIHCMACKAVVRVLRSKMAGRGSEIGLVARIACCLRPGEFSSRVTPDAGNQPVGTQQGEARFRMIERRGRPAE